MAHKRDFYFSKSSVVRKEKVILDKLSRSTRPGMTEGGISLKDMLASILETNPGFLDDYINLGPLSYVGLTGDENVSGEKTWTEVNTFQEGIVTNSITEETVGDGVYLQNGFQQLTPTIPALIIDQNKKLIRLVGGGGGTDGIIMPDVLIGSLYFIVNDSSSSKKVYPYLNTALVLNGESLGIDIPMDLRPGQSVMIYRFSASGFAAIDQREKKYIFNIDATSFGIGNAQSSYGLLDYADVNVITNIASGVNDSVTLQSDLYISEGYDVIVKNLDASNNLNVFPEVGATINNLGLGIAYVLAAGEGKTFVRISSTKWITI